MELYLQYGHGMKGHCLHFIERWGGGTAILSPRDLEPDKLAQLGGKITALPGGRVLLDPQLYAPGSNHLRLCRHAYWPADVASGLFWKGVELQRLIDQLIVCNRDAKTEAIILPGLRAEAIDAQWLEVQRAIRDGAERARPERALYPTIALSPQAIADEDQLSELIEELATRPADGYYVVCESPADAYLIDDPIWLSNVLDLLAGIRLLGSKVILGYCHQQLLIAGLAKVDAIATGTYKNVRSFSQEKFFEDENDDPRRRAKWYYCPQALSEFKIAYLDIAQRGGVLPRMMPLTYADGGYVDALFSGARPSTVYKEGPAHRHYIHALHEQAARAVAGSFEDTVASHRDSLNRAEALLTDLAAAGVLEAERAMTSPFRDASRAAIIGLERDRGAMLKRQWNTM